MPFRSKSLRFATLLFSLKSLLLFSSCEKLASISKSPWERLEFEKIDLDRPFRHIDFYDAEYGIGYVNREALYHSRDGGLTWSSIYEAGAFDHARIVDRQHLILIAHDRIPPINSIELYSKLHYALVSDDAGETFRRVDFPISIHHINGFAAYPDGMILISSYGRILKSSDFGSSWTKVHEKEQYVGEFIRTDDHNIFATTTGTVIYKSTDRGESWATMYIHGDAKVPFWEPFRYMARNKKQIYLNNADRLYTTMNFNIIDNLNTDLSASEFLHVMEDGHLISMGNTPAGEAMDSISFMAFAGPKGNKWESSENYNYQGWGYWADACTTDSKHFVFVVERSENKMQLVHVKIRNL